MPEDETTEHPISLSDEESNGRQLVLFDQALQLERERIRSQDRRTEVALRAFEMGDAADKRQFEFHMEKLKTEERIENKRLGLSSRIALILGLTAIVFLSLTTYMLFFGSDQQAARARELITWVFTALGGGGFLYLLQRVGRWLMNIR